FLQNKQAALFQKRVQYWIGQKFFGKLLARFHFIVRWIGKDDPKFLATGSRIFQKTKSFLLTNSALEPRLREIFVNRRNRLSIFFDKERRLGAATQCFNTERAGAGKKIQNPRADDHLAKARENCRLHPIHGWANAVLRRNQPNAAGTTGDDSHGEPAGFGAAGVALNTGVAEAVVSSAFCCFFFFVLSPYTPEGLL